MEPSQLPELGILGPLVIDQLENGSEKKSFASGTILFALWTAAEMNCTAKGYSTGSREAIELVRSTEPMLANMIDWKFTSSTHGFVNQFDRIGKRNQSILELSPPIILAPDWKKAKYWHIGPLCNGDIDLEVYRSAAAEVTFFSVDLQGFTRARKLGSVSAEIDTTVYEVLQICSLAKMDFAEAKLVFGSSSLSEIVQSLGKYGLREALITDGINGAWYVGKGRSIFAPAKNTYISTDPSGCGDVFATSFIIARSRGLAVERALEIASILSAENAKHMGIPTLKT